MVRARILALSFLAVIIGVSVLPVRADWVFVRRTYDATFTISAPGYHYVYGSRSEGDKEVIDFTCTAGGSRDVYFFICDQENFQLWTGGYTVTCYCRQDAVVSWTGEFVIPSSGTWYHIFSNMHSLSSSKTVQLTIDLYEWQSIPSTNPAWIGPIIIGGVAAITIVAVAVIVMILVAQRKRVLPTTAPTALGQPPTARRFCPQCGRPIDSADMFCSNCGHRL